MSATKMTRKAILRFDRLEGRCVLVTWPLPPVNGPLPIMTTYGQWQEGGTFGIHFHEGIDIIPVNNGIAVYPVENGMITGVVSDPVAYNSFMVVETNAEPVS